MGSRKRPRSCWRAVTRRVDAEPSEAAKLQQLQMELDETRDQQRADLLCSLNSLPHYSRYSKTSTQRVPNGSGMHDLLQDEFLRSTKQHRGPQRGDPHREAPKLQVLRIDRIFGPRTQDKYLSEIQDIAGLCERRVSPVENVDALKVQSVEGLDLNEFMMYHGAPSELISRIQTQGLDPRYAGTHFGKMYGAGIYLTSTASKADIYTTPNADKERCVLLVRACLGEAFVATEKCSGLLKPPERADKRGPLNSVVAEVQSRGGAVEHPEYIVYKESQALPEYAIWYSHLDECRCTHCFSCIIIECSAGTLRLEVPGDVNLASTVQEVKSKVSGMFDIPIEQQILMFGDTELQTAHTLEQYRIELGSILRVIRTTMQIFANVQGRLIILQVEPSDKIRSVMASIEEAGGPSTSQQQLHYGNKRLHQLDATLRDHNIHANATLEVTRSFRNSERAQFL